MSPHPVRCQSLLRRFPAAVFLLSSMLFVTTPVPVYAAESPQQSIKIGLNYPSSGRYKEQGLAQIRGALLAVKEINSQGGVNGQPLELLRANTASKPERAAANVDELIAQGAVMLFGGASSSATIAAAERAAQHKRIYFGTLGYDNEITGLEGQRYLFREPYSSYMAARALAEYMNTYLKGKKFFYLTAGSSEGWSMEGALRSFTGTQGITSHPAARTPFPNPMHRDFQAALRKAVESGAEVLVVNQLGQDMVLALNEIYAMDLKKKMTVIVPNLTLGMAQAAGPGLMEGVIGAAPWTWKVPYQFNYQRGKDFVEAFVQEYQLHPSSSAASAYSIVYQFADAVNRSGSTETEGLIAALENHRYKLLKDEQSWRDFDHQNQQTVYVVRSRKRDDIMLSDMREDFFDILLDVSNTEMNQDEWQMVRTINDKPLVLE